MDPPRRLAWGLFLAVALLSCPTTARVLSRDGQVLNPYLGYTGGSDVTHKPFYHPYSGYTGAGDVTHKPFYYPYSREYSGPLPDVGYNMYRNSHHDFRNGGAKIFTSAPLMVFLVSCTTIFGKIFHH